MGRKTKHHKNVSNLVSTQITRFFTEEPRSKAVQENPKAGIKRIPEQREYGADIIQHQQREIDVCFLNLKSFYTYKTFARTRQITSLPDDLPQDLPAFNILLRLFYIVFLSL